MSILNGLSLDIIPDELKDIRPLEKMIISQRIHFMKLIALPRGRQRAIHGPAVNVPTSFDQICTLLPRLPNSAQVVPLKLKRKLSYKGHYIYEFIRPQKVMTALKWLISNNPLYKDATICPDWETRWVSYNCFWYNFLY